MKQRINKRERTAVAAMVLITVCMLISCTGNGNTPKNKETRKETAGKCRLTQEKYGFEGKITHKELAPSYDRSSRHVRLNPYTFYGNRHDIDSCGLIYFDGNDLMVRVLNHNLENNFTRQIHYLKKDKGSPVVYVLNEDRNLLFTFNIFDDWD